MNFDLEHAIDEFCTGIHVARSQDEAIRQEIASHLREKYDYYRTKPRLSESEAFVLATHALGDPEQLVAGLRQVHGPARAMDQACSLLTALGLVIAVNVAALVPYALVASLFQLKVQLHIVHFGPDSFATIRFYWSLAYWINSVGWYALILWSAYRWMQKRPTQPPVSFTPFFRKHFLRPLTLGLMAGGIAFVLWLRYATPYFPYFYHINGYATYDTPLLVSGTLQLMYSYYFSPDALLRSDFWPLYTLLVFIVTPVILTGLGAYVVCGLTHYLGRSRRDSIKAAFVPLAAAVLLALFGSLTDLAAKGVMYGLLGSTWNAPASLILSTSLLQLGPLLAISAVGCLLGWVLFERRAAKSCRTA